MSSAPATVDAPEGLALSVGSEGRCTSASASSAVSWKAPGVSATANRSRAMSSSRVASSSHTDSPVAWCNASRPSARQPWSSSTPSAAPTSPFRELRRNRPSTRCRSSRYAPADTAASTHSGRRSAVPASANAVIARPFHAAITLSSRAGCGRVPRA